MKPMLAHKFEPKRWPTWMPAWLQDKFDGIRALNQMGFFQSREELPMEKLLLKHLSEPLRDMFPEDNIILDGELYVHGWPLGRINGAVTPIRQQPNEDTLQVCYYIFDRVSFQLPFEERFALVSERVNQFKYPQIFAATTVKTTDPKWADEFYTQAVTDGFEGIMYRLGNCPYTTPKQHSGQGKRYLSDKNNRTWHLLKRKDFQDDEFECVAVEEGVGKRRGMVGALVCELLKRDGTPFYPTKVFRVGSGFTEAEATHYLQNPPIGKKVKVKFRCYTADGVPFNPTIITIL